MTLPNPVRVASRLSIASIFSTRRLKMQVLGFGLGMGIASSAFGQIQNGGFGSFGGTLTQPGQTGQTGGLGGLTGGLGQTGATGQTGGLGQTGQAGAQSGAGIQLGANTMANAFGSGGILGTNTSSAFGGLANSALLGRSLNGGAGGMNGAGGMGGMNGMNGGRGGQGGRGGFNAMNQNQNNNKTQVRATVKLGFDYAPTANAVGSQVINSRLSRIPSAVLKGVNVEMNGRTAVITGKVATLADAKVVERFLSLEPGISAVKNELTIASGEKVTPKGKKTPTASKSQSASQSSGASSDSSSGNSTVQAASPEIVPAPGPQ